MKKSSYFVWICLLLLLLPLYTAQARTDTGNTPANITGLCTLTSSSRSSWQERLLDEDTETHQDFKAGGFLQAEWEADVSAAYMYVEWDWVPQELTVLYLDASGQELARAQGDGVCLNEVYMFPEGTRCIRLEFGQAVRASTLAVYAPCNLPYNYHPWEGGSDKLDYLIVAMHPDDDTLFMGGVAATLSDQGYRGTIAYMATRVRRRCNEALNGAYLMGIRKMPVLAGFPDIPRDYEKKLQHTFKEQSIVRYLVGLFRQYKPEVVFSHDVNGEYGHWQHKRLSAAVQKAVEKVSDPTFDPESAEKYGVWTVKKCYLHLYPENTIHIDMEVPLASFEGKTAHAVAQKAFLEHVSQQNGNHSCSNQGVYSLEDFGLYYTAVGTDTKKDSFFENIDPGLLSNYLVQTLVPTATPEPMPEFTPSPAETPSPMPTEVPVEKTEKPIFSTPQIVAEPVAQGTNGGADPIHIILLVGALLMLAGGIAIVILLQKRK